MWCHMGVKTDVKSCRISHIIVVGATLPNGVVSGAVQRGSSWHWASHKYNESLTLHRSNFLWSLLRTTRYCERRVRDLSWNVLRQ